MSATACGSSADDSTEGMRTPEALATAHQQMVAARDRQQLERLVADESLGRVARRALIGAA